MRRHVSEELTHFVGRGLAKDWERPEVADASAAWSTDLDDSQPGAWRYLVEAETDNGADIADHR